MQRDMRQRVQGMVRGILIWACLTAQPAAAEVVSVPRWQSVDDQTYEFSLPVSDTPLVLDIRELGRDVTAQLTDAAGTVLARHETPGNALGRLVILLEPAATTRLLQLAPDRASSAAGDVSFVVRTALADELPGLRLLRDATQRYAHEDTRPTAAEVLAAAAAQLPSNTSLSQWGTYWAALAENEYGRREAALRRLPACRSRVAHASRWPMAARLPSRRCRLATRC